MVDLQQISTNLNNMYVEISRSIAVRYNDILIRLRDNGPLHRLSIDSMSTYNMCKLMRYGYVSYNYDNDTYNLTEYGVNLTAFCE